ncbi:NRDE family protein [Actinorugispora endophytica]|uniref:Transport and Golgi organization protein 2 n=1 Tax=Actinorugispora endophytica TaxID=1605990 RepID=A0A4R6UHK3_9ACTN|nr:NRDE family protein [Actinorugispora endophytica]TDQ45852.1 transport and Golgi organization protein 2 [Actinorugispora endophytica]
MCTAIVGFDPSSPVPLVIAALRDEMTDRPFDPPAAHWPRWPGLVGGRDALAGGTWLAAAADGASGPRVAAVLNGRLDALPASGRRPVFDSTVPRGTARRSRGELPLRAAATGGLGLDEAGLRAFDPFHLVVADAAEAVLLSWDGGALVERGLDEGVNVVVNTGLDRGDPRAVRNRPLFERARPVPDEATLRGADAPGRIWGGWVDLLDAAGEGGSRTAGTGTGRDDPSALAARIELADGRVWATGSVTLLAVAGPTLRYAFTDAPGDPGAWRMVR